jgi:hypothetical protein
MVHSLYTPSLRGPSGSEASFFLSSSSLSSSDDDDDDEQQRFTSQSNGSDATVRTSNTGLMKAPPRSEPFSECGNSMYLILNEDFHPNPPEKSPKKANSPRKVTRMTSKLGSVISRKRDKVSNKRFFEPTFFCHADTTQEEKDTVSLLDDNEMLAQFTPRSKGLFKPIALLRNKRRSSRRTISLSGKSDQMPIVDSEEREDHIRLFRNWEDKYPEKRQTAATAKESFDNTVFRRKMTNKKTPEWLTGSIELVRGSRLIVSSIDAAQSSSILAYEEEEVRTIQPPSTDPAYRVRHLSRKKYNRNTKQASPFRSTLCTLEEGSVMECEERQILTTPELPYLLSKSVPSIFDVDMMEI